MFSIIRLFYITILVFTKDNSKNPTKVRKVKVAKNSDDIMNNRAIYEEVAKIIKLIK